MDRDSSQPNWGPGRRALFKGFGFVEFENNPDEKPKIEEARPQDESLRQRAQRRIGIEAIDQTNEGEK